MAGSDRPSPLVPPGTPGTWATALAAVLVLGLLAVLLCIVAVNAVGWFWPAPVYELHLSDGSRVAGTIVGRERIPGAGRRVKVKVGARELDGRDFRWIDENTVTAETAGRDLVRVVRTEYGDLFGRVVSVTGMDGSSLDPSDRRAVAELVERSGELRRRLRALARTQAKVRRPLTAVEEAMSLLEHSARADTIQGKRELADLEARRARLAATLAPGLAAVRADQRAVAEPLSSGAVTVATGRGQVVVHLDHLLELNRPNTLSTAGKVGVAARRAFLFLVTEPREANTEGGIFPALFGTVLLVLIMSVAVVPLGVITALYMTEYARDGFLLRLATQAVNNLAGVPSTVFGMFGMAFFIYGVGGTIDRAFFADRLPTPTFGTGGILWASLTLALLTVPVVVVATREGLLAVPGSWREASLALGATKWQTLRRIIVPAAMPGILPGLILAVGRAAGEVAPLMLTGAVKLAPSLPADGAPPFLHLERKFMHLGFHIYDVSMQSPNVEAAKPMAFATTLVLLALVAAMNLTAILVRRRLRRAYRGSAV